MRRWSRRLLLAALVPVLFGGVALITAWSNLGARLEDQELEVLASSAHYDEEGRRFVNALPPVEPALIPVLIDWIKGAPHTSPSEPPPVFESTAEVLAVPPEDGLRVTWFGHSSMLVEIDGARILTDPVWGDRVTPWSFMGPHRFHRPPLELQQLPELDAVVISHDHYDHLDAPTIRALKERVRKFVVPLGVGAHLRYWGVPPDAIVELDWWESHEVAGVELHATPARHFSGRMLVDRDATLWAGWAFVGPRHRAYFSGDTGMFPGFREIGERLGPFDLSMIESGAYNEAWADVHVGPEQAVQAHLDVRGGLLIPVHWGTFDLALHAWTEPAERIIAAADRADVRLAIPKPGQSIEPSRPPELERWWPDVPWQSAEEAPVVSSGLGSHADAAATILEAAQ